MAQAVSEVDGVVVTSGDLTVAEDTSETTKASEIESKVELKPVQSPMAGALALPESSSLTGFAAATAVSFPYCFHLAYLTS